MAQSGEITSLPKLWPKLFIIFYLRKLSTMKILSFRHITAQIFIIKLQHIIHRKQLLTLSYQVLHSSFVLVPLYLVAAEVAAS